MIHARAVTLSSRTGWDLEANPLASRLAALRAAGAPLLDLSETNPTRCGLAWPAEILASALAHPDAPFYQPEPRGLEAARRAVGAYLSAAGVEVPAGRVVLGASTSEAYSFLLKLLCDPGDEVLAPAPSYPLLDVLCDLESVRLVRYPLRYDGEWYLERAALEAAITARTRAVLVVSPANPTGAVLAPGDLDELDALCASRGLALICDEVFRDTVERPAGTALRVTRCLGFHLSGLSKTCGLPQMKVAWIVAAGPEREVRPALERLEMIADAALSVSGPAQLALPALLQERERFLAPLRRRLRENRAQLSALIGPCAPISLLRSHGGWSAVLRIGERVDEEETCLDLLDQGVVVQPGYFYDFERRGHLVLSLLPEPHVLREGVMRLLSANRLR
jgi:alanine-synthesizing transaminase